MAGWLVEGEGSAGSCWVSAWLKLPSETIARCTSGLMWEGSLVPWDLPDKLLVISISQVWKVTQMILAQNEILQWRYFWKYNFLGFTFNNSVCIHTQSHTHTHTHYIYIYIYICCCLVTKSVWLFCKPIIHQASLSMWFPRQEYWSALPFPPPGESANPRIEPLFSALQAESLSLSHWESLYLHFYLSISISMCVCVCVCVCVYYGNHISFRLSY